MHVLGEPIERFVRWCFCQWLLLLPGALSATVGGGFKTRITVLSKSATLLAHADEVIE